MGDMALMAFSFEDGKYGSARRLPKQLSNSHGQPEQQYSPTTSQSPPSGSELPKPLGQPEQQRSPTTSQSQSQSPSSCYELPKPLRQPEQQNIPTTSQYPSSCYELPMPLGQPEQHYSPTSQSQSQSPPSCYELPKPLGQPEQQHSPTTQCQSQSPPSCFGQEGSPCSYGHSGFPPGTNPAVIRSFEMVDKDRSGYIDENELQEALSSGYQRFSLRTIRLLMFLFRNPKETLRVGPKEFAALWSCLGQWRVIFEKYDMDKSGNIDAMELRDAVYSLGLAVPASVLLLLISKYEDGNGRRVLLNFDSFVECGMIVKGLTDKFKEKDVGYNGSATLTYDAFMYMVIPFLVSYN